MISSPFHVPGIVRLTYHLSPSRLMKHPRAGYNYGSYFIDEQLEEQRNSSSDSMKWRKPDIKLKALDPKACLPNQW